MSVRIDYLADRQEHLPELARWFFDDFGDYYRGEGMDCDDVAETFRERLHRDRIPIALVASDGDTPLGAIALLDQSVTTHPHLAPWLGGLYVHHPYRHRGVATRLLEEVIAIAKGLGVRTLYAGVAAAQQYYVDRGWTIVEWVDDYHGAPIAIIQLELQS